MLLHFQFITACSGPMSLPSLSKAMLRHQPPLHSAPPPSGTGSTAESNPDMPDTPPPLGQSDHPPLAHQGRDQVGIHAVEKFYPLPPDTAEASNRMPICHDKNIVRLTHQLCRGGLTPLPRNITSQIPHHLNRTDWAPDLKLRRSC